MLSTGLAKFFPAKPPPEKHSTPEPLRESSTFLTRGMDGTIRLWSIGCQNLFGWTAAEAIGQQVDSLLGTVTPIPDTASEAAPEHDGRWIGELIYRRRDGAEVIAGVHQWLRRDTCGHPAEAVMVFLDVTAQRHAEIALLESEERFQTYFNNSADCLFHVRAEPDGRFIFEAVNPAGLAHAGKTLDQARGRTPQEVLGAEIGGTIAGALRTVFETGKPYRFEPEFDVGSRKVIYDAIYLPLRNEAGEITGILGDARDISEHRQLEALLRQTQKMDALGQLAGGVAHDFNNVLGGLLGSLELLEDHVATDDGKAIIAACFKSVERGKALTARLLSFARQQPMINSPIAVNALIEDVVQILIRTLGGSVQIESRLAEDLWPITGDRNQLELALLNLAINARDAMPSGGRMTIGAQNETIAERQEDGLPIGQYTVIAVDDDGEGMTPDVLAKAVEPFFSTKTPDKGTGLGLSMVYGLMLQLGGGMRIASAPGKGTRVTLFVPRAETDAPEPAA